MKLTLLKLMALLCLSSLPGRAGQVFDLAADWSDSANPNGVWSYNQGANPLPHIDSWTLDSFPTQGGWAAGATVPFWFKSSVVPPADHDWKVGDVVVHSQDDASGPGHYAANVTWTSPFDGFVDISGSVWIARDIGRANQWKLYVRGTLITTGIVYSGDGYSRAKPFNLSKGDGGPDVLQGIAVRVGDVITLEIGRTVDYGDYTGVNFTVTQRDTPPPPDPTTLVYSNNFENGVGPEWTNSKTSIIPISGRKFLGDFGSQVVNLNLTNLPAHTSAMIEFDLFILRTWDGNYAASGPDNWELRVVGGPTLIHTGFNNHRPYLPPAAPATFVSGQLFPGGFSSLTNLPIFPAFTAATETNTLGFKFTFNNYGIITMDSVYHIKTMIPHNAASLSFAFVGIGLEALANESWGLDNVQVRTVNAPAGTFDLSGPVYAVGENKTNAIIHVNRLGGSAGAVSVNYATTDDSAVAGVDYLATSGVLSFADGETNKDITIPILDDSIPEALEQFSISLTSPTDEAAVGRASANVIIVDDDGFIQIEQANYVVPEIDAGISVNIHWTGASNQLVGATLQTHDGTAHFGTDFYAYNEPIIFNPGETTKSAFIYVRDDSTVEVDKTFNLALSGPMLDANLDNHATSSLLILDNDSASGPGWGANWQVEDLVVQPNGKVLIGGGFNQVNSVGRTSIARLNEDGSLDTTFNPGSGANNWVETIALQPDGKLIIGGWFGAVNGVTHTRLARLNSTGSLDTTFDAGASANNTVYKTIVQPDGKILVAGAFTSLHSTARNRIGRLNQNGTLDTTFDPGTGADSTIWGMGLQSDSKIIVSGSFLTFNGTPRARFARLNIDGSVDNTFNVGSGANGRANAMLFQPDGKIILGGVFTTYNGSAPIRMMRLNPNGSIDTTFNVGSGPNSTVWDMVFQSDGKIIVVGEWSVWNGVGRGGIVRLNPDGSLDNSFAIDSGANAYVGAVGVLTNGNIAFAGNFSTVNGVNRVRYAIVDPSGAQPAESVNWTQWKNADGGNDHFYALTSRPGNWNDAESEALSLGGHLVTIRSDAEQVFLTQTFLKGLNRLRPLWIGLSDSANEGGFVWASNESSAYTHWYPGEPNNQNNEDFAAVNWHYSYQNGTNPSALGFWNDEMFDGDPTMGRARGPYYGLMERGPDGPEPIQTIYTQDFEAAVGSEWSESRISTSPVGARKFLGDFGQQTVNLSLANLPVHTSLRVSFDLFILNTWDGSSPIYGPDLFSLTVRGGPVLLYSTFSNNPRNAALNQSYPSFYPGGSYPGATGAAEYGTLGYPINVGYGGSGSDSVYHLVFEFPHTNTDLQLDFAGLTSEVLSNESWGLDNVNIAAVNPSASPVTLSAVAVPAIDTHFQLRLSGSLNTTYSVEASLDLINWTPQGQVTTALDGTSLFSDPVTASNSTWFYRAIEAP